MFNGVVGDVTGSRVIPKIDMAAAQTGSNTNIVSRSDNTDNVILIAETIKIWKFSHTNLDQSVSQWGA